MERRNPLRLPCCGQPPLPTSSHSADQERLQYHKKMSTTQILTCPLGTDHVSQPNTISPVIKQSKTDQARKGVTVVIGKTGDDLCPVSAFLLYLALRGNKPGPLFQWEDGSPLSKPRKLGQLSLLQIYQLATLLAIAFAEGQQQLQQWWVSKTPPFKL